MNFSLPQVDILRKHAHWSTGKVTSECLSATDEDGVLVDK